MKTDDEVRELELRIKFAERQIRVLEETLLDHFAQSALASGRCSPGECYNWAKLAMEERKNYVRP